MPSRVPSITTSPSMLTPYTNDYPDSKTTEIYPKSLHDKERPKSDPGRHSNTFPELLRPELEIRKYSDKSTYSGVDMRTYGEPITTYDSFPFPEELPPWLKKGNEGERLNDLPKHSNGDVAEKHSAPKRPNVSRKIVVPERLTALENQCANNGKPVASVVSTLFGVSPDPEKLIVADSSHIVLPETSIVKQVGVIENPIVHGKPSLASYQSRTDTGILHFSHN